MSSEPESSRNPDSSGSMRILQWAVSLLGAACVAGFIIAYPPANELAWEAAKILFSLLSTPFLLEGFFIIVGFVVVIFLNNRRLAKETADEWVTLEKIDPAEKEVESQDSSAEPETR